MSLGGIKTAQEGETVVNWVDVVSAGLAIEQILHFLEFRRHLGREVGGLRIVAIQSVELPAIGYWPAWRRFVLPRHAQRTRVRHPAIAIDRPVAGQFEVLRAGGVPWSGKP